MVHQNKEQYDVGVSLFFIFFFAATKQEKPISFQI